MKLKAMAVNTAITAGWRLRAMAKPTGMRKRPMATQKAGNVSQRRQHREFDDGRANDAGGGAEREGDGAAVGQIASRREQQDHDRGEHDRLGAARPRSGDPEQLDRSRW